MGSISISFVEPKDLPEVARIQREAFATSSLFFKQVYKAVNPADIDRANIKRYTPVVGDPHEALIKATVDGQIVGIAYYSLPSHRPKAEKAQAREHPPGVIVHLADEFFTALEARGAELRATGQPFYHLHVLVVDPVYFGKGIGSALLDWGVVRAQEDGVSVHLEATEAGLRLYGRRGFLEAAPTIVSGPGGQFKLYPVSLKPSSTSKRIESFVVKTAQVE